jgi:hypothetical protein
VAANKKEAGNVRLTAGPNVHGDLEYAYEIGCRDGGLHVRILRVDYCGPNWSRIAFKPLFEGSLDAAQQFATNYQRN